MHKYKRGFISAIALLLCFLTIFSCAFANDDGYTNQKATSGYPQPPTYKGGNGSTNSLTTYTDPVIVGYRFTCWRSTDYTTALQQGLIKTAEDADRYLKAHNEPGYKLGHSINIFCNAVDSNGNRRTDYANDYSQTGLKMPHMLTNGAQDDFLDKITTAQLEQKSDATIANKITHSTATGLMLMDYAGSDNGNFTSNTEESSYVEFYEPLYLHIYRVKDDPEQKALSTALSGGMSKRNPLILYSGYYARTQWNDAYLNGSPENDGDANNLYTFIYGYQSKSQMGTTLEGYDRSSGVTTISDIDYDGTNVLPFNQNPANVINSDNPNTWTNRNASLIAYLCGLEINYGVPNYQCTDEQFGAYDYIIVEPIMMYYYYYTRYYVTSTDTAILQAQSMCDKVGNATDVWTSVYYKDYKLFDVCGKFPASFGTYVYTEEAHFGVDGVFNATTGNGFSQNPFRQKRDGLDLAAIASHPKNTSGNSSGSTYNTYAIVFTTSTGNTLMGGGDNTIKRSGVNQGSQIRIRDGENSFFLAPYVAVESLIGTGVYCSELPGVTTPKYQIIYHTNPNSGGVDNNPTTTQTFTKDSTGSLMTYQAAISKQPVGKIPSAYWTFSTGNNGYGIADNTLSSVAKVYPNAAKKDGKIAVGQKFNTWSELESFFAKYGSYNPATNNYEVHLYAAWSTKSLVTTVDRTYDSSKAQTLKDAALQDPSGSMWLTNTNYLPKSISVVATTAGTMTVKDIIELSRDTASGYQWFQAANDAGNLDNSSYDYYIVYSFEKDRITDSDKTAVQNSLNNSTQSGLMIYRNNGVPVKWEKNTNLFYFDFYSFDIEAANCSISATITNYPNKDNTVNKVNKGKLELVLPRGSSIAYTVTPDTTNGYYFDTEVNFATFQNWTNSNIGLPQIRTSPDTKNNSTIGSSYLSATSSSAKYPKSGAVEVLGKQCHTYNVESGKKIIVRPWVDGVQMAPFSDYYVDIVNVATQQAHIYSSTKYTGAITIPANANGIVTQAITGDGQYHILVSATDQSGRTQMQKIQTVNTASVTDEVIVDVYYYSASFAVKTQDGGNHSGVEATLYYTPKGEYDIDDAISILPTTKCPANSSTCDLCTSTRYSYVEGVALKDLQLNITRNTNSDWYITGAKRNGSTATVNTDKLSAGFETAESGDSYIQTQVVAAQYHTELTLAPYHYIRIYKDGKQVNVTDMGSTPSGHTTVQQDGYTVWRGTYNQAVTSLSSIVKTDKTHISSTADSLSLSFKDDAVTYTTLYYYTVDNDADDGYVSTVIKSASGASVGSTAYILNRHNDYKVFHSCDTGLPRETSHTTTNTRTYTASATLDDGRIYMETDTTGKMTVDSNKYTKSTTYLKSPKGNIEVRYFKEVNPASSTTRAGTCPICLKTVTRAQKHHLYTPIDESKIPTNLKPLEEGYIAVHEDCLKTVTTSSSFTLVNGPSTFYWKSIQPRYDVKFIFRINSVPYDSLPDTINSMASLVGAKGTNQLTFKTEANGDVVAVGSAVASSYNLYLKDVNTGVSYTVTTNSDSNVYYIDFYTLRVAAGAGIANVSLQGTDVGKAWNGTLPYYRDGRKFATTLAVWPESIQKSSTDISKINISATASPSYTFNRWDTKRPTSNIKTTFNNGSTTTTTTQNSYVNVKNMNHATVVQAEATTEGTPIIIPSYPEHNSVYYGVKVRTFLDGRLTTPWANLNTYLTPTSDGGAVKKPVVNGTASWAVVLDLVGSDGKTPVADPYNGSLAQAVIAPSKEFDTNAEINTEYFYSASNAYIANQYTYIDAFYYTQTVQTQVNGVNTYPWTVGTYKEVMYRQYYKNCKVDTTAMVSVNDAGAFQTIMMKDMKMKVGGLPVTKSNPTASNYQVLYQDFVISGNHAFIIPYYTVDMRAICDKSGEMMSCGSLTLTFNGTNMKTSVTNDTPALVMAGSYSINTSDSGNSHGDGAYTHNFLRWDLLANEVFILEYVDSGDGTNPYPVLTYTGESRPSNSTIISKSTASTTVTVKDETHLVANYLHQVKDEPIPSVYTLKLNSVLYDTTGKVITPSINPIQMYRGDNAGNKFPTATGESNQYGEGTQVNISATLDPQTIYYPTSINVTFKLTCPHCGTSFAYDSEVVRCTSCNKLLNLQNTTAASVYYSTKLTFNDVQSVVEQASKMTDELAAEYLAKEQVVVMKRTANGTYTGTIPYSESPYYLYVNGVKQGDSYTVTNNKKTYFTWGKYDAKSTTWAGTAGINGTTATTTNYSDFYITMDKNREYTVYAYQKTEGTVPTNKSIDFVCATIYTATDYTTNLPYGTTYVYINDVKTALSSPFGHTFMVIKGSNLTLSAQRSSGGNGYCDIFNGTVSANKTFLLSYNTITVSGDKSLTFGIDGTDSQRETMLANYAIDSGAFQSANTTYGVYADGSSTSNMTVKHAHSSIQINTSAGQVLELVAKAPTLSDSQELTSSFSGPAGEYYLYILPNTAANNEVLEMKTTAQGSELYSNYNEQYIIGFSKNPAIPGNLIKEKVSIGFLYEKQYQVIVDWSDFSADIVAAEGTKFTAGSNKQGAYKFITLPNGIYEIHMNGTLLVTTSGDIESATGSVSAQGNCIFVKSSGSTTITTSTGFGQWVIDNTPGTAAKTQANAGTISNTTSTTKKLTNQVLNGTINYYAKQSGGVIPNETPSVGNVVLPAIIGYKVEVYLDDKLATPFTHPVKFNGSRIEINYGESDIIYSLQFPKVSAVSHSHDPAYSEVYGADGCTSITYDSATHTFKVYYYSVTYDTDPGNDKWGKVLNSGNCLSEEPKGPIYVAKGTSVSVNEAVLTVGGHQRSAAPLQVPGYQIAFSTWTKNSNDELPTTITEPTHFIAHFINVGVGKEYTVTLYNKTKNFTGYLLNQTTDKTTSKTIYHIKQTSIKDGLSTTVSKNAPNTVADIFLYGDTATLSATVTNPVIYSTTSSKTNITLQLTGYTSELAHTVKLVNTSTGTTYTAAVAANGFVANFTNIPTGYYQLYIDDIKYSTPFSYDTHSTACKVETSTNALQTPNYATETGAGGLIYVAPQYNVRYASVSHWSQVRTNRITGETTEYANLTTCTDTNCSGYGTHAGADHFANWTTLDDVLDPAYVRYYYACNECGATFQRYQQGSWSNAKHTECHKCSSTHIRMTSSVLITPEVDEDLNYYVYSTYTNKSYAPISISVEVEMAYPVYVQSVVDGVNKYPFYDNGTKVTGATAYLEYTVDGSTWTRMSAVFDNNGLATFFVPMGTSYRIVGATADEFAVNRTSNNIIDGGFSLSKPYSVTGLDTQTINGKRYIVGDGDYDNNGDIDDPGITYYCHYYTVTAVAGHGIDDVNTLSTSNQSKYSADTTTTVATYQRGATAKVSAAIADGYLPVYIKLGLDNANYPNRTVYLSTSSTTNTQSYQLKYNSSTQRYENSSVFGTATGTTYYVWANGRVVNGTAVDEYTGVSLVVKPYVTPVKWSGNCKHDTHTQTYNVNQLCGSDCSTSEPAHISSSTSPYTHTFTVYHTTVEQADAQDTVTKYTYRYASEHPTNPSDPNYDPTDPDILDEYPQNTVYYYNLVVTGDAGTSSSTGTGVYLEGATPGINIGIQSVRPDVGRTPITVKLYLDNTAWAGRTVTIGGYPAKEISTGVYQTDYNFASGTYAVVVSASDITLLDNGQSSNKTVYGYITVSSTRTYTWKAWTDGHVTCSECGVTGACCDTDGTPKQCNTSTLVYCTNCHITKDSNNKEQSCCTTGDKKHTWTTCPYSSDVYHGNCLDNLVSAQTQKGNTVTMWHNTKLHGVTTHVDNFTFTGDTGINFTTLHIYGDAGIDSVKIHGTTYQETTAISRHGKTALNGTTFNKELPDRIWTNTRYEYTFFKVVAAKNSQSVSISATTKTPVTNHAEAKTALSVELTANGKPYTGRTVTIGGYAATDTNNDGIYVTSYSGFVGGNTYKVVVDGREAGEIKLTSTRSYRFYMWDEPWTFNSGSTNGAYETDAHTCKYHGTTHTCEQCAAQVANYRNASTTVIVDDFPQLVARTEFVDEFVIETYQNDDLEDDSTIKYFTVTVNTRLNNAATDDFPIKFENLTSGVTIYIIPDGQTYYVYDSTGKQLSSVPYISSMTDGKVEITLQDGDKYRVSVLDEIEDANNNDTVDIGDIKTPVLHQYTYTTHTEKTISGAAQTVTIDFYTLTLNVYSDGTQTLPIGKTVNGSKTNFEAPVWLDDVSSGAEGAKNWWGETTDSIGDTGYYAVGDAKTVKVYLKGQTYDVNTKTADDDSTSRTLTVGNGYLADHTSGTVGSSAVTVNVYYYSMTVDHHGGFKGTQINYGGKTHASASTTAGATGNATVKAFFLSGTKIDINATLATNNTWYQWTGSATYSTQNQTSITMDQTRTESAWAKTFYTVRYYLHDKAEGWYKVTEDCITSSSSVIIDNRNWNSVTVTGEPNKYVNFDPFRTHSYSDPNATSMSDLHDVLATGVVTTTIDVVINANQVGGQSFVDFYYTRNGSKVDPTPDTPTVPDVTPTPEEPTNPTPQKPEDWNPDKQQEYVTITYVMNGGKYNGSSSNYSETHYVGTDITLITPTPPTGKEFIGWFLTDYNTTTQSASGLIGTSADHYLLCQDTTVYAVYVGKTDLGITANDIYGSIKTGSQFTSSATIVNTNKLSITPNSHINAVLTIKKNGTTVDTITLTDVIVPGGSTGTPGTQMIYTVVDTTNWDANATYTLTWSLDFSKSLYVDSDSTNNTSSLNSFKPNTYSAVVNTARPGYSTDRPSSYDKDIDPMSTSNTAFNWEYWTWNEKNGYNGVFSKQTGSDKMNIVIMLTPENESGLRTYTTGALGMHNYTTRSGYGLSMHRVYNDLTASWPVNKSHLTVKSTVGTLEALMTFPEFNHNSAYKSANGTVQEYVKLTAANAGSYYSLTMPQYTDYETDDYNDQFAHYTPMWLPNGEYIPVTHISGLWTPIGELRATVQQGQYTDLSNMQKFGIYTNEIIIKGSLFDDLYNNP